MGGGGSEHGGQEIFFKGTYVTEGVVPGGHAWVKNPIPITCGTAGLPGPPGAPAFPPKCTNTSMCTGWQWFSEGMELVDFVRIPADLPAGEYVLGWRWDCEQSNQIWQSCS